MTSNTLVIDVEYALPTGLQPAVQRPPSLTSFIDAAAPTSREYLSAGVSRSGTGVGTSGADLSRSGTGIGASRSGSAAASPKGSRRSSLKELPLWDGVPLLLSHQQQLPALQHQAALSLFDIVVDAEGRLLQVGQTCCAMKGCEHLLCIHTSALFTNFAALRTRVHSRAAGYNHRCECADSGGITAVGTEEVSPKRSRGLPPLLPPLNSHRWARPCCGLLAGTRGC